MALRKIHQTYSYFQISDFTESSLHQHEGEVVGEYFADLLIENAVIVELKAAKCISDDNEAQLLNYLRATPYEVGLLLNFGPQADFRRKAYDNERKPSTTWIQR